MPRRYTYPNTYAILSKKGHVGKQKKQKPPPDAAMARSASQDKYPRSPAQRAAEDERKRKQQEQQEQEQKEEEEGGDGDGAQKLTKSVTSDNCET